MLYVIEDIGGRPYQEDRHNVKVNLHDDYDYVAVFDGHGGHQVSDFLKFNMKDYIKKHLQLSKHPRKALQDAFTEINDIMPLEMSYMTGSAALVILRKKDQIWIANSGDCRAILSFFDDPIALSKDHKPDERDEFDRISRLGGHVTFNDRDVPRVQGNLALSRSLGDKYLAPYVICDPEVKHFNLSTKNKYIVMASDGLWDVLSNNDVSNIIGDNTSHASVRTLLNESRKRGSTDNITILLWEL